MDHSDVRKYIQLHQMNQRLQEIPDKEYEESKHALSTLANYVQNMKNKEKNKYTYNCACSEIKRIQQMIESEKYNFF